MLLLYPTKKVAAIARINLLPNPSGLADYSLLNEWFVDIVGLGKPGKNALLFVHRTTYVCVIVPGSSLNKAVPVFKDRLTKLLLKYRARPGLVRSILQNFNEVTHLPTNDRKTLGVINNVKEEINILFKIRFDAHLFEDWDWLEHNYQTFPHKPYEGKGSTTPEVELRKFLKAFQI